MPILSNKPGANSRTKSVQGLSMKVNPFKTLLQRSTVWETSRRPLVKILSFLNFPEDLFAAIKASPALLGVFRENWQVHDAIMRSVILNAIQPTALQAALGAIYCPEFTEADEKDAIIVPLASCARSLTGRRENRHAPAVSKWQKKVSAFLGDHKTRIWAVPTREDDLVRLYKLYRLVRHFLSDYIEWVMRQAQGADPLRRDQQPGLSGSLDPVILHNITPIELGRLQRALFNYELSCRLSPAFAGHLAVKVPKLPHHVTLGLPPWEAEGVLCIQRYLYKRYEVVFGKLEGQWDQDVRQTGESDTKAESAPRKAVWTMVAQTSTCFPYLVGLTGPMDEKHGPGTDEVATCIERMITFGLGFAETFMLQKPQYRHEFIKETMYALCWVRSDQAKTIILGCRPTKRRAISKHENRHHSRPNKAWKLVAPDVTCEGGRWIENLESQKRELDPNDRLLATGQERKNALRELGFVFWSGTRLDEWSPPLGTTAQLLEAADARRMHPVSYRAVTMSDLPAMSCEMRAPLWNKVRNEWMVSQVAQKDEEATLGTVMYWVDRMRRCKEGPSALTLEIRQTRKKARKRQLKKLRELNAAKREQDLQKRHQRAKATAAKAKAKDKAASKAKAKASDKTEWAAKDGDVMDLGG